MATIYIDCFHHEPHSEDLTGLDFTIVYRADTRAQVSVAEMPPIPAAEQERGIRDELRRIGEAIVQAARSPQGIVGQPYPGR